MQRAPVQFETDAEVEALARRLVTSAGARLDDAVPANSVQNTRGQRIHAVLPPVASQATALSIRLQPSQRFTLSQWLEKAPPELEEVLTKLVSQRANFLVSGGTGSGKTTLLNALLSLSTPTERLITLEDSAELAPEHPHVISLLTKDPNAEGRGAITLQNLIQESLRMGPDRIILGECRGAELIDLLMAMNTGHSGSGSTVHANSAKTVPARLLAMGSLANLDSTATSLQAATAIDYIIHCEKQGKHRRITEISRCQLVQGELTATLCCQPIYADASSPETSTTGYLRWEKAGASLYRSVFGRDLNLSSPEDNRHRRSLQEGHNYLGKHERQGC